MKTQKHEIAHRKFLLETRVLCRSSMIGSFNSRLHADEVSEPAGLLRVEQRAAIKIVNLAAEGLGCVLISSELSGEVSEREIMQAMAGGE